MTEKEEKALEIITPYLKEVMKFKKERVLRNSHELRKPLSEAYYLLTNNRNERTKIANNSCSSCATRALNTMYNLVLKKFREEEAAKESQQKAAEESKKKSTTSKSTTAKKAPAKKRTTTTKSTRKAPRKTSRSTKGGSKK